mgnify:CR=1 FL=1
MLFRSELTPFELVAFPGRTFYRNAGETLRYGLETALRWRPARGLDLNLVYTRADFQYQKFETPAGDFAGRRMPGLPRHWGMLEGLYSHAAGFYGRAQLRYVGRYFADDANAVAIEPYALVNLRIGYERRIGAGRFRFFLGADNVFNTRYFNNVRLNAAGGRYYEPGSRVAFFSGLEFLFSKE